mmetsp:Transcript_5876/g.14635  ORF Transcript_5876/g.14635 Transcript_5876/m.14635 type:complete len:212 (-) Transcript_5876:1783-2418(-)
MLKRRIIQARQDQPSLSSSRVLLSRVLFVHRQLCHGDELRARDSAEVVWIVLPEQNLQQLPRYALSQVVERYHVRGHRTVEVHFRFPVHLRPQKTFLAQHFVQGLPGGRKIRMLEGADVLVLAEESEVDGAFDVGILFNYASYVGLLNSSTREARRSLLQGRARWRARDRLQFASPVRLHLRRVPRAGRGCPHGRVFAVQDHTALRVDRRR